MAKAKDVDLQKHTLNLRQGDYDKLGQLFVELGAGPAIRQIVSAFVDKHYGKETN
mgnify:CR=1 FL=1